MQSTEQAPYQSRLGRPRGEQGISEDQPGGVAHQEHHCQSVVEGSDHGQELGQGCLVLNDAPQPDILASLAATWTVGSVTDLVTGYADWAAPIVSGVADCHPSMGTAA